jgi:PTH1 family peptidyl-tRNA hydrolase
MNLSGDSVQPAQAFHKIPLEQVVVIHDELDLPFGDVRLKVGGGHAGHNGLRSIIERSGAGFVRVRFGIGRPPASFKGDVADFVLNDFASAETAALAPLIERAREAVRLVVSLGSSAAMNRFNAPPPKPKV